MPKFKITFFIRNDKLGIRINLGRHNRNIRRSLGLDMTGLTLENNTVQGLSVEALAANKYLASVIDVISREDTASGVREALDKFLRSDKQGEEGEEEFLLYHIEQYHSGVLSGQILTRSGKRPSVATIESYASLLSVYRQFLRGRRDLNVYDVDIVGVEAKFRVQKIRKAEDFFSSFLRFLASQDKLPSTQEYYFTKLKTVLHRIEAKLGIRVPTGDARPPKPHYENNALPVPFIKKYLAADMMGLNETDRACFIASKVQILACMRAGDLFRINADSFKRTEVNGQEIIFLVALNKKGQKVVKAPIHEDLYIQAMGNIEKYGYLFPPNVMDGKPKSRQGFYNRALKRIFAKFPEMNEQVIIHRQNKHGNLIEEKILWLDLVSSHKLRGAGVNLYSSFSVEDEVIRPLGGWSPGSKAYDKHYKSERDLIGSSEEILRIQQGLSSI